jgi:hypothetical protein
VLVIFLNLSIVTICASISHVGPYTYVDAGKKLFFLAFRHVSKLICASSKFCVYCNVKLSGDFQHGLCLQTKCFSLKMS